MVVKKTSRQKVLAIGGLDFYSGGFEQFLDDVLHDLNQSKTGYICVTNIRTLDLARRNRDYAEVQRNALYRVPDGVALCWHAKLRGVKSFERICGPDLLGKVLSNPDFKNSGNYFYGSTERNIRRMQEVLPSRFPNARFCKFISPPFQSIDEFKIDEILDDFEKSGAQIFWCGLGSPKQDYLISELAKRAEKGLFIGVGLAFDYLGGNVKRAPIAFRKLGLEGIFRLTQQPSKINLPLFRRYLFALCLVVSGIFR